MRGLEFIGRRFLRIQIKGTMSRYRLKLCVSVVADYADKLISSFNFFVKTKKFATPLHPVHTGPR